jgi:hypothetical protein
MFKMMLPGEEQVKDHEGTPRISAPSYHANLPTHEEARHKMQGENPIPKQSTEEHETPAPHDE